MKRHHIFGILISLIGAGAIFFCIYLMNHLQVLRAKMEATSSSFGNNPFASVAKGVASSKLSQYDALVVGGFVIGGLLLLVGLSILIFGKKGKKK